MKSNNKISLRYRRIIQALYAFGALLAVFFTASVLTSYDKDMHYFSLGDDKPVIYVILSAVLCVVSLLSVFLLPKDSDFRRERIKNRKSPASFVCGALCIISMLAVAVSRFSALSENTAPEIMIDIAKRVRTLNFFLVAFAVLSAVYFLLDMLNLNHVLKAVFGFAVVGFFIVYLLCIYYDTEIPINSPMRILDQVSVIATLMWFLLEERNLLRQAKPYLYVSMGIISFTFSLSLSASTLLAAGLDRMNAGKYAVVGSVLLLTFSVWSATRVYSLVKAYFTSGKYIGD